MLSDPRYLVCHGTIESTAGSQLEVRWVKDEDRQRIVALQVKDGSSVDWRVATRSESERLIASLQARSQLKQSFRARRLPIWAEALSSRRHLAMVA